MLRRPNLQSVNLIKINLDGDENPVEQWVMSGLVRAAR